MANHKSAIKRIRQAEKRTMRNRYWRKTMRTHVKRVESAISAGDAAAAQEALPSAVKYIDKCATKGVLHHKNAARKVSRLTKMVNELAG